MPTFLVPASSSIVRPAHFERNAEWLWHVPGYVDEYLARLRPIAGQADQQHRLKEGGNIAAPTAPEAMRRHIEDEIAHWKQIVEASHIKVD